MQRQIKTLIMCEGGCVCIHSTSSTKALGLIGIEISMYLWPQICVHSTFHTYLRTDRTQNPHPGKNEQPFSKDVLTQFVPKIILFHYIQKICHVDHCQLLLVFESWHTTFPRSPSSDPKTLIRLTCWHASLPLLSIGMVLKHIEQTGYYKDI